MQYGRVGERFRALTDLLWQSQLPAEIDSLCNSAVAQAVRHANAAAACLRLLDAQGTLRVASSLNCDAEFLERFPTINPRTEPVASVLRGMRPMRLSPDEGPLALSQLATAVPSGWVLLVPVVAASGPQGLLSLMYSTGTSRDTETEDWLTTLATLLATSISNAKLFNEVDIRSRTDALTGLGTRRHFEELLRRELARARRAGTPLSLAMLDVDGLKQINDQWGHVVGDRVLQTVGRLLEDTRATDVAARFGGDEFVLLMPDTTAEQATAVAHRVRRACEKINAERRFPFRLGVSIGIRQMTHLDSDLISEADAAMYADKRSQPFRAPLLHDDELNSELEDDVPLPGRE
jgi:diguanylate cyclase (GGDEF)-like protein